MPGLKIGVDNKGMLQVLLNPNEVPLEAPGIVYYQTAGLFPNTNGATGIIHLGENFGFEISLEPIMNGDSLLQLEKPFDTVHTIEGTSYFISLLPNEFNRAGKLFIRSDEVNGTFEEKNNKIFKVLNEFLNDISTYYCIPINFTSMVILHDNISLFTFIEKPFPIVEFKGIGTSIDSDLWHIASGNYRKALSSKNPMERFSNLILAIEGLRATTKKVLTLDYKNEKTKILHSLYDEPVLDKDFSVNVSPRFPNIKGKTFWEILYSEEGLRDLRNEAAHVIRYNGNYRLNTNFDDFNDYHAAIQYLHHMFKIQSEILEDVMSKLI